MRTRVILCSCLLTAALTTGCKTNADTAVPDAAAPTDAASGAAPADAAPLISFADAIAAASAQVTEGVAYEVEFETLDGKDVIEVEFLIGASVREAYIDPASGEVITVRDEPADHTEQTAEDLQARADMVGAAQVSLPQAADIGADHVGGTAEEVEYVIQDGKLVADVEVRNADDTITTVFVDAVSGEVVSTKDGE